jgi:hypothetical protein
MRQQLCFAHHKIEPQQRPAQVPVAAAVVAVAVVVEPLAAVALAS